jgi:3'-phosphoadenosine 5'-phosphosulfate sulfotransferase (PAPS reductase)/FAD synthetase
VEYPQTYKYRDKILKEWDIKHYHENVPIKSFWQCVKEYGYPKFRQMKGQGGKKREQAPKCCWYCKEKPFINFVKKIKIDLNFIGLQASESMVRRLSFLREGEVFNSKKYGCRIVRPLMIWTNKDIWNYHEIENIPKNSLYDLMERNGCMPCTGFKNWKEVMNKANPKLYEIVSKQIGEPTLRNWCS